MKFTPNFVEPKFNVLTNGRHPVAIKSAVIGTMDKKTGAWESLNGKACIMWEFKVLAGPSKSCVIKYETPLEGTVTRKKDNKPIDMSFLSQNVIRAIDPSYANGEFDTEDFVGKKIEIDIEVKTQPDGRVSMWPQKVNGCYPYVETDSISTPLDPILSSEDQSNMEPKHAFGPDDDINI